MTPTDPTSNSRLTNFFTIRQQVKVEVNDGNHKVVNAYTGNVGKVMEKLFGYQKCTEDSGSKVYYISKNVIPPASTQTQAADKQLETSTQNMAVEVKEESEKKASASGTERTVKVSQLTPQEKAFLKRVNDCEGKYKPNMPPTEYKKLGREFVNICKDAIDSGNGLDKFVRNTVEQSNNQSFLKFCVGNLKPVMTYNVRYESNNRGDEIPSFEPPILIYDQEKTVWNNENKIADDFHKSKVFSQWTSATARSDYKTKVYNPEEFLDQKIQEQGGSFDKEECKKFIVNQVANQLPSQRGTRKNIAFEDINKSQVQYQFGKFVEHKQAIQKAEKEATKAAERLYGKATEYALRNAGKRELKISTAESLGKGLNDKMSADDAFNMRARYGKEGNRTQTERACKLAHDAAIEKVETKFKEDMKALGFNQVQIIGGYNDDRVLTITLTKRDQQ